MHLLQRVSRLTWQFSGMLVLVSQLWRPPVVTAQVPAAIVPSESEKEQSIAALPLANAGDANAQWMVGQGLLSPPDADPAAAFSWLRRAAEQGHPLAQRDLGLLYEAGWGVTQDLQEAYFWYSLAAMHDSGRAVVRRDELALGLSREQLDNTNRRVQSWRPQKAVTNSP